jgi:hypothetical protein
VVYAETETERLLLEKFCAFTWQSGKGWQFHLHTQGYQSDKEGVVAFSFGYVNAKQPWEPMDAEWLADKIGALGDYGQGAALKLREQAARIAELENVNLRIREVNDHKHLNTLEKVVTISTILTTCR